LQSKIKYLLYYSVFFDSIVVIFLDNIFDSHIYNYSVK